MTGIRFFKDWFDPKIKTKTIIFIAKANKKHGRKYVYNKTIYKHSRESVTVTCPTHGDFKIIPNYHLQGDRCKKCTMKARSYDTAEFKKRAIKKHGGKFCYKETVYKNSKTKVKIRCRVHGVFKQSPDSHISGKGCPMCSGKILFTTERWVVVCNEVHDNKYDYSKVSYVGNDVKVKIQCPTHGYFKQLPLAHRRGQGCPVCKSSKGERKVKKFLDRYNIRYERQFKIKGSKFRYDFYLQDLGILIEYDGEQHFRPVSVFGGTGKFKEQRLIDSAKTLLAIKNKKKLIRIPYTKYKELDNYLYTKLSGCGLNNKKGGGYDKIL